MMQGLFCILSEQMGCPSGQFESPQCFVDVICCVFRGHGDTNAAGVIWNGWWPDCWRIDSVRQQSFGKGDSGSGITDQDRKNRTDGFRHAEPKLLKSMKQTLPITPQASTPLRFLLNDS